VIGYILRRLLLIIPTLLAIVTVNFIIVQVAPGGPVDQAIAQIQGMEGNMVQERIGGSSGDDSAAPSSADDGPGYRGSRGLNPQVIAEIEKRFGFDKPLHERYFTMMGQFLTFNFGDSFFRGDSVIGLIRRRIPVSVSLGLWTLLIVYGISIPLGVKKAVREGSPFDLWTSTAISIGYAIPGFLFALLLIILFAGGSFLDLFPLKGLVSDNWSELSWWQQILDYFWHLALPIISMTVGGFASLTIFTKNAFLDEISKQYVITARAKGNNEKNILWKHVFRNGMLLVIAGFPAAFIGIFFTGSFLIETMFSIDGLGLLGLQTTMQRDYPVMFGTLFIFSLIGLVTSLLSDIVMMIVDPRLDFEGRTTS